MLTQVRPTVDHAIPELGLLSFPYANTHSGGRPYLEMVKNPHTIVVEYTDATWDGRSAKRLLVEFGVIHSQTNLPVTTRVAYFFRPADGWVCCGCQLLSHRESAAPPSVEWRYTYEPRPGELPSPKRAERRIALDGLALHVNMRLEVTEFRRHAEPLPDRDFTLAAYALPEPDGVGTADPRMAVGGGVSSSLFPASPRDAAGGVGTPWWVWPTAAGAAAVGLTTLTYRRRVAGRRVP